MSDPLTAVLRLVADGRLSAAEAEPILAALDAASRAEDAARAAKNGRPSPGTDRPAGSGAEPGRRTLRVEVSDAGRVAVNLRLPASLGELGLRGLPGLSGQTVERIREALAAGTRGPVFEAVDESGDGVRIVIE